MSLTPDATSEWQSVTRETSTFAELLIDCEEDEALRAVLFGILREDER